MLTRPPIGRLGAGSGTITQRVEVDGGVAAEVDPEERLLTRAEHLVERARARRVEQVVGEAEQLQRVVGGQVVDQSARVLQVDVGEDELLEVAVREVRV
jgi:hypothetical protein